MPADRLSTIVATEKAEGVRHRPNCGVDAEFYEAAAKLSKERK
jgi:hypothetical protein